MSRNPFLALVLVILSTATMLWAQTPQVVAIRRGHVFNSNSGQMLNNQVVLNEGEKISEVGATDRVEIPSGAQVIDLSRATVLPGLVDGHTHVFSSLPAAARVTTSTEV